MAQPVVIALVCSTLVLVTLFVSNLIWNDIIVGGCFPQKVGDPEEPCEDGPTHVQKNSILLNVISDMLCTSTSWQFLVGWSFLHLYST